MAIRACSSRSCFLVVVAALLAPGGGATAQPAQPAGPPRAGAPRKPAARDNDWPRQIRAGDLTISLDAPQAESLEGTKLKARGTARIQREGETEPSFGTIWYEAEVGASEPGAHAPPAEAAAR